MILVAIFNTALFVFLSKIETNFFNVSSTSSNTSSFIFSVNVLIYNAIIRAVFSHSAIIWGSDKLIFMAWIITLFLEYSSFTLGFFNPIILDNIDPNSLLIRGTIFDAINVIINSITLYAIPVVVFGISGLFINLSLIDGSSIGKSSDLLDLLDCSVCTFVSFELSTNSLFSSCSPCSTCSLFSSTCVLVSSTGVISFSVVVFFVVSLLVAILIL